MNVRKYAKAIVALVGAVLAVALKQFAGVEVVELWGPIVVAFVTAFGVYIVPNLPGTAGETPSIETRPRH